MHALLVVLFIRERHPTADLHFFGRHGRGDDLRALQALVEVAQVAFQVGQSLLVRRFAQRGLRTVLRLQAADVFLQQSQAFGRDVVDLCADQPLDRLLGLGGSVVFVYECAAHEMSSLIGFGPQQDIIGFVDFPRFAGQFGR